MVRVCVGGGEGVGGSKYQKHSTIWSSFLLRVVTSPKQYIRHQAQSRTRGELSVVWLITICEKSRGASALPLMGWTLRSDEQCAEDWVQGRCLSVLRFGGKFGPVGGDARNRAVRITEAPGLGRVRHEGRKWGKRIGFGQ